MRGSVVQGFRLLRYNFFLSIVLSGRVGREVASVYDRAADRLGHNPGIVIQ
jgi:hypothetical protein